MPNRNQDIIENALRLLVRARAMSPLIASEYLAPLANLSGLDQGTEAEQAAASVAELLASLRSGKDVAPQEWGETITSLQKWKASLA